MKKLKCKGQFVCGELVALDYNGGRGWNVFYYNRDKKVEFLASMESFENAEKIYRNQIEVLRGF